MAERLPLYAALGRAVKELRGERELTQEALAFASGLDRTFVGAIERGKRNVTMTTLERLAHGLEIEEPQLVARAKALQEE